MYLQILNDWHFQCKEPGIQIRLTLCLTYIDMFSGDGLDDKQYETSSYASQLDKNRNAVCC